MKKNTILFALLFLQVTVLSAQNFTIGTYNIRYDTPKDTGNKWVDRLPVMASLIRFHDFDILGTQEVLYHQLQGLDSALKVYAYAGIGRDDGINKGEHSAIFYKKDKYKLLTKGDFWLSETPDKPSLGWDAKCCYRICSWVQLQDIKTKNKFFVFNAHFDHQGVKARNESSKLILNKIKEIVKSAPVIFMGDLNASQEEESYLTVANSGIVHDAYQLAKSPYALNGTSSKFDVHYKSPIRIDHIFLSDHFKVEKYGVLTDSYGGKYPSDHFPVLVDVTLQKQKNR